MKHLITILFLTVCNVGQAQKTVLTTDNTLAIPKLNFDPNRELKSPRHRPHPKMTSIF